MEIEWYFLTFELILKFMAINEIFEIEEKRFSSKFEFLVVQLIKDSSNQKGVLDYLS